MRENVAIHKMKECKKNAINKYFFQEDLKGGTFILNLWY